MELCIQSMAASKVEGLTWVPRHAIWMEFGPSHDYERSVTLLGAERTAQMYPQSQGWVARPCKVLRLGVEWMYAIMQSEKTINQVFGLSLSTVIRLEDSVVGGIPFRIFHQPYLVSATSLQDARQQGVRQAQAWWPKNDGFLSWGVKAWHISAEWFRREMETAIHHGALRTIKSLEANYANVA